MKTPASTLVVASALCGILLSLSTASAGHVNTTGEPTATSTGVQVVPVRTPSTTTPHSPSPAPNGGPATMGTDSEPNVHNGGVNLHPYTQEINDYIVAQHNYARAFLTPSDAANMRQLKWNETLAIEASEHVNSCVFAHETEDYTYGQNLMYGNPQIDKPTVDSWIQAWVTDELSPSDRQGTGYLDLDHASAVLWATSYYVGCASNLCPKGYLTACNYYTPGNWVGEQTYIPGTPCSQCPSQATYCDATGKLCTVDPPVSTQVPTPAPTTTTPKPSPAPTTSTPTKPAPTPAPSVPKPLPSPTPTHTPTPGKTTPSPEPRPTPAPTPASTPAKTIPSSTSQPTSLPTPAKTVPSQEQPTPAPTPAKTSPSTQPTPAPTPGKAVISPVSKKPSSTPTPAHTGKPPLRQPSKPAHPDSGHRLCE